MLSLTLNDWLSRTDPKGDLAGAREIVEVLNEESPVLDDAMFMEANGITSHRTIIRTGLPSVAWRLLNYGVPKSKSTTMQVDDRVGMLETWSAVDASLAALNGQSREFMLSEEAAFIEAMGQEVAKTIFYGDLEINAASFLGLTPRYSTFDQSKADSAKNVINYGGANAGTNASLWFLTWGDRMLHMIYPKGSPLGLKRTVLNGGEPKEVTDENGDEFMGIKTHYKWDMGLTLRDWRYCVRICNIDTADLTAMIQGGAATSGLNKLYRFMIEAINLIPNVNKGRTICYAPREVCSMLDMIAAEKSNVNLTINEFMGKKVTHFKGIPVKREDALEIGEKLVA
jgi:hypothetical protein